MIYKNVEFYNVEELIELEDGSVTWRRVPKWAEDTLEKGSIKCPNCGESLEFSLDDEDEEELEF